MVVGCFQICCGINDGHGDNNGQRRKGKIKIKNAFEFAYDDQYYNNKDDGRAGGLRLSRNTTTGTSTTASVATAGSWPSTTEKASSALRLKRGNVHCHDRASFFSSPVDVDEARTYKCHCYPKSDEERHFIITNYQKHELFYDLTPNELDELVSATQKLEFTKQGQVVTQQDDTGEGLYLVQTGRLAYYDDGDGDESDDNTRQQVVLESGDLYGELDLMLGQQRAAKTLTVTSPDGRAVVWKLNHRVFRCLLAKHSLNQGSNILSALRNVKLFQSLADQTLAKFADALVRVTFIKGDRIVTKGEIGDAFYIIEEGQVKVHDIGIGDSQPADIILGPGDSFGERSLLTGGPRAANVTALSSKVTTFAMDRQTFEDNIGQLEDLLNFPTKLQAIKGLPIFTDTDITDVEYQRIAELTVEVCYKEGSKLFQNGRPYPPCLWMIRSGQVIVYGKKSQHIYNFQTGDYLGDKSILNPDEHISSHDATCETNVDAWVLKRDDIQSVIVDLNRLGKTAGYLNNKRESLVKIGLDDLKRHKILGQGGFGKVWLVQSKSTRHVYALKIINKRKLLESKHERSVLREKEMLELLHHPFILHLVSSFQDETNLYFVLPVIQGGELFSVVSQKPNGLSAHDAAFYGICIIEALGHFHHRYIAYRDLKLENVMIDTDGYIRIVDLGFSKVILEKSYTFCGTPDYLAPEIILTKGHSYPVDYWSFGVLMFEMLSGRSPFSRPNQPQLQMLKRIVMMDYEFPTKMDTAAKDLIGKLLQRNVTIRLGVQRNGYRDIRDHPFFKEAGADWKKIMKKDVKEVPWRPKVQNLLDPHSFDDRRVVVDQDVSYGPKLTEEEQELFADF